MKKATCLTDDQRWQSVLARDPNADGEFVFAVRTTGIFCRPSCRARHALRENVSFYANASEALAAGFRPCKRCQPEKANAQQHRLDKITHACRLLEQETPVTLEALADQVAMSPSITNVSKEEYGEGDFTKGVYVSVPLDLFSSGPTRSRAAIGWTPLTRDGGQQLGRKFQLYDMTSDRSVNFR